jgi:hypothetical protein
MLIRQGFKYRLDTTDAQSACLRVLCGHARFVWNQALAACNTEGQYVPRYESMAKWVTDWKKVPETEWLKEAYTDNLQQKLKDLDTAWQRYFKKVGDAQRPRFKKKGRSRDSIRFVNFAKYCKLEGRRVKLPSGLGWVKFRKSRDVLGTVKNCTIGFDGGHWFISFQTERQIEPPKHSSRSMVGLDLGVTRFFTLSDGTVEEPVSSFKKHQDKLARAQRALARKIKFSANWQKQKARINRIHTRIASVRRDALHKTSTTISKNQCASVATLSELQGLEHPVATGCKTLCLPNGEIPKGTIACTEKLREGKLPSPRCVVVKIDMAKPDWLNPRQDWDNADPILTVTNEYVPASEMNVVLISDCHCREVIRDKRNSHTGCLSRLKNGSVVTEGSPKGSNPYGDGAFIVAATCIGNTTHVTMGEGEGKQDKLREESELW